MNLIPQTTAVVVTYQSESTISTALAALRRCHDEGLAKLVVVDNASTDGTKRALEAVAAWATVIHSPKNFGFGRGCNLGLSVVDTPYVVFVNPDAELDPEACAALVEFHRAHPKAGLVSSAMIRADGSLQHAGGLTTPWSVLRVAAGLFGPPRERKLVEPGLEPFQTDWVCGALIQAPTTLLRELGGFDPRFFLYFEETDLCQRIVSGGYEIWAVGTIVIRHAGGASSAQSNQTRVAGCIAEHYFRSRFYYLRKHFGCVAATAAELGELVFYGIRAGARVVRGRDARDLLRRFGWPILSMPERAPTWQLVVECRT